MTFKTLRNFDLKGKRVLLRADLNVPAKDGKVTDSTRIDRLKPTIDYLASQGAKTIVMSHFGRPKGGYEAAYSLAFLVDQLKKSWSLGNVAFAPDCIGKPAGDIVQGLQPGGVCLLENLRFHKGEEANDPAFAAELAKHGDVYINDAFSAAHRAHASTEGIAHLLPAGAGMLMEAELKALNAALGSPQRPVAAIVGGAKISTKLELLGNLVTKTSFLILGGGMANTFLLAKGIDVKKSLCEREMTEQARTIMDKAKQSSCEIVLPIDGIAATKLETGVSSLPCLIERIPDGHMVLDLGPQSVKMIRKQLATCKTILWNGPVGAFELAPFDAATAALARFVATETKAGRLKSVAGGGDTVAALEKAGVAGDFSYVSTAGGAFLEWLEGKTLPGVAALMDTKNAGTPGHAA